MTHGFGGTSLFYYDIAAILRRHSEIILFDLRGLGLSDKVDVEISDTQAIIGYFVEGVEKIRQFYKHTKMTMVAHSLGAYVCMLYASAYKHFVEKLVMFSPIGITPK
jgi:pimeloyl-ACP methyl ester carboxylesterase